MDGQRGSLIYSNGILQEYVAKNLDLKRYSLRLTWGK